MARARGLDDRDERPQLAFEFEVALQHDVVGEKRDRVRREAHLVIGLGRFDRQENRVTPTPVSAPSSRYKRLEEILFEGRGERGLQSGDRIEDDASRADLVHRRLNRVERFVHRQVQRAHVDNLQQPALRHLFEIDAERPSPDRDTSASVSSKITTTPGSPRLTPSAMNWTAVVRLAGPDRSRDEHRITAQRPAAEHLVETGDACRNQLGRDGRPALPRSA